jgi:gliding motility-associated-like protein
VDPDNEQPTSGSFTTTNTVLEQPPVNDDALVGATGLDFGCFLGLGARDPDARAAIGDAGTTFAMTSPYDIWNDGPGYSTVLGATITQDWSISLAFYIDELLPGECVVKSFAYVLDTADLDEALAATASIPILADGVFVPDTSFVNYCVGDSVELEILGDSTATWVWTPALGLSVDTGRTVLAAPSVPTTYTVLGYRECDTLERELTIIPIDPDGFADAGPDLTICAGDTIALQGVDVPLGTTWNPGVNLADPTDPMTLAWPPVTTQYVLSAETGALCPSLDTMILTVIQPPVLDATPDTIVCAGSSIQLEASNAVTYQWTPVDYLDNAGIANPVSTPDATVTYAVEGVDGFGCVGYDTTTITVLPLPAVDVGPDWIIDLVQDEFALLNGVAPTAASFSWDPVTGLDDPGSLTPSAQPELPTTYILTVTDANGCVNSDTVFVDVLNEFSVILPDAFTPNGDGLNDVWRPVTIGLIEFVDVSIYNRWGERLYFSRERSAGWDGTFMGKAQEMGSYIAVVRIRDPKGQPIQTTGTVTLIR